MKKQTIIKIGLAFLSLLSVMLSWRDLSAASPWPADANGQLISIGAGYEPSGIIWHSRLNKFFVVSDNGTIISMDADGNNKTFWNVGGDLEAVTIVDPNSNYIYVGIEHPDSIKEVDITTGKFTGKVWDLTQWLTGPDNSGLEALTFVPNGRHSHEASPSGGLFYAGLQADGKIYLFDIDLAHSGIVTFEDDVITPVSGRADISDMFYSNKTDTLYAIFDGANSLVEMAHDGAVLGDYALPLPNREQEGVVVVSPSPTLPAQI